jgi:hypothetical protein
MPVSARYAEMASVGLDAAAGIKAIMRAPIAMILIPKKVKDSDE